jgi:hypothetical protein
MDQNSPSSVAVTGFLPRVLSFLNALSHQERGSHRPSNLFFQLQSPLSLERVLYKLANKPHRVQHYMTTIINVNPDLNP